MEREMESRTPSIIDLNAELAKLTMFRGLTPQTTRAERRGSGTQLGPYRDGILIAGKSARTSHWETHPEDELVHVLERIQSLDAGSRFHPRFAGTRIPTLAEVLDWAKRDKMGLVLEIKEAEQPDLAVDRVASLLAATSTLDRVVVISFDHVVLKRAVERHPGIRTQAITHARHTDIVGVLRACGAASVSIEFDMFHPDDGRALHMAGCSNRVRIPRRERLDGKWRGGGDHLAYPV